MEKQSRDKTPSSWTKRSGPGARKKARLGPENNGFVQDEKKWSNKKVGGGDTKNRKKEKGPKMYRGAFGE